MTNIRRLGLAVAAAALFTAAVGPAEAVVRQSWDPEAVAYHYTYYNDEAKTQYGGEAYDTCGGSAGNHWVLHPYIPTPYYDQEPMYVCTSIGPYMPPDW